MENAVHAGHTPGGACYFLDPATSPFPDKRPLLLSGDTLFCGSIGRTDFEGGNMGAMRASLARLSKLPDATIVLPGHNSLTTIQVEQKRVFAYYL
ncbi:MAG: MBL fold metallo-hydrolase [Eggerthellaceae bacterium]|jgi:hydroxyacylglutathione hydrolase